MAPRPPPGYRRGTRPIYPGTLRMVLYGFVLWGLSLLGLRLPIDLPWWLLVVGELLVIWFLWKGWKAARRAPGNHLRLFNAQENWANAFALQALILFLW
ncbi:MAG TPA: hypothetical protein VFU54_14095 [Actinomycetota bacterium]|jgi:hypothetical protein|nr:hypothetical protein [Actinomycetota bacterium]